MPIGYIIETVPWDIIKITGKCYRDMGVFYIEHISLVCVLSSCWHMEISKRIELNKDIGPMPWLLRAVHIMLGAIKWQYNATLFEHICAPVNTEYWSVHQAFGALICVTNCGTNSNNLRRSITCYTQQFRNKHARETRTAMS